MNTAPDEAYRKLIDGPITSSRKPQISLASNKAIPLAKVELCCIALGTRNRRSSELTVGEVTCVLSDDVLIALQRMREGKIRWLPVVCEIPHFGRRHFDGRFCAATKPDGRATTGVSYHDAVRLSRQSMDGKTLMADNPPRNHAGDE
jgi:hypothetical protein